MLSPLMIIVILFMLGIAAGHADFVDGGHTYTKALFAGVTMMSLLIIFMPRWVGRRLLSRFILMMFLSCAAGWMANHIAWRLRISEWNKLATHATSNNYSGEVTNMRRANKVLIANVTTDEDVNVTLAIPYYLLQNEMPKIGERLVFTTRFKPMQISNKYNMQQLHSGTVAHGYVTRLVILHTRPSKFAARLRRLLLARLKQAGLDNSSEALAAALILAYRTDIDKNTTESFRNAGAAHVLALSGMHLGLLTWLLYLLLGRMVRDRWRNTIVSVLFVWTYAMMAGLPLSLVRAALLHTVVLVACLAGYRVRLFDALWTALLILLICQPHALYDIGAQLSFVSVFGLGIMDHFRPITHRKEESSHWYVRCAEKVWKWTKGTVIVSLVCTVDTLPLTAWHFGRITLYSCVSSLVLIPMTYLTILNTIAILIFPHPVLCETLSWIVESEISVAEWFADLPFSVISLNS